MRLVSMVDIVSPPPTSSGQQEWHLNEHALEVLEYHQVIEILAGFATSGLGQLRVRQLRPLPDTA